MTGQSFTVAQLVALQNLARRTHDGMVHVTPIEKDGLDYLEVAVLLTDMGESSGPLHVFWLTPRGIVKPRGG